MYPGITCITLPARPSHGHQFLHALTPCPDHRPAPPGRHAAVLQVYALALYYVQRWSMGLRLRQYQLLHYHLQQQGDVVFPAEPPGGVLMPASAAPSAPSARRAGQGVEAIVGYPAAASWGGGGGTAAVGAVGVPPRAALWQRREDGEGPLWEPSGNGEAVGPGGELPLSNHSPGPPQLRACPCHRVDQQRASHC